jgi:hypothetical protein
MDNTVLWIVIRRIPLTVHTVYSRTVRQVQIKLTLGYDMDTH